MRDLDTRSMLLNDFIIVYGDVISNLPLHTALSTHKARRQVDKNAIMTMILREANAKHRTKAQDISPVFVIDPSRERCLHYEQLVPGSKENYAELDSEMLAQDVEVRTDLIDCGIDICTPDVLALWSDNFDYEAPRKGFLHSVLKDYELNGKTVHSHVISNHYAARVRDLHAYDSISRDVLSRLSYPLCPDSNFYENSTYCLHKDGVCKETGVKLARSSKIGPNTVIGKGTSVGENSRVAHSIIGRNCFLGKNCVVQNAYIWDGVIVGDGAELRNCVVASGTDIGANSEVVDGGLVSYGVKLPEGTSLGKESKASRRRKRSEHNLCSDDSYQYELETDGGYSEIQSLSSSKTSPDRHSSLKANIVQSIELRTSRHRRNRYLL